MNGSNKKNADLISFGAARGQNRPALRIAKRFDFAQQLELPMPMPVVQKEEAADRGGLLGFWAGVVRSKGRLSQAISDMQRTDFA